MALFGLNKRSKRLTASRVVRTTLPAERVLAVVATTVEAIPPRRGLLGRSGHRYYTHRKTGNPTVGFGVLDKEGKVPLVQWAIEFAVIEGGVTFVVTYAKTSHGDLLERKELERFFASFEDQLRRVDAKSSVIVADS